MTHDESLALLLAPAERTSSAARRDAEVHVASCSDCWETLALLHALAKAVPPPDAEQARALYGCDRVREDLFELVGLRASDIVEGYPLTARHLSWCRPCGSRFAELLAVERAAARGEFGPPITAAARAQWRDAVTSLGRQARELVGTIVARVREGVAVITAVPEGLLPMPVPALAGAQRSRSGAGSTGLGQRVEVPFGERGESVGVTLLGQPADRVGIEVRLVPSGTSVLAVSLRVVGDDGEELIGSQTPRGGAAVVFRYIPPGRYLVGVQIEGAADLRIPLTVEPAP